MKGIVVFYGIWFLVCTFCLYLVDSASNYLSKEWQVKDIVQAIVLFPISIVTILFALIFDLIDKFEESKPMQAVYNFLNKPIKKNKNT